MFIPWELPNEKSIHPYGYTGDDVSANWPALSMALRLLRTQGLDKKVVAEATQWLLWQKETGGWMSEELGSRNSYGIWLLISVLIMFRFKIPLSDEWLTLWWTWMASMRVSGMRSFIMYGGMRSAQHGDHPGLIERAADLAFFLGLSPVALPEPLGMPPYISAQRPPGNWEYPALDLLVNEIRLSALTVRNLMLKNPDRTSQFYQTLFAVQPKWKTKVPVNLEIGSNGRGYWMPRNVNGNTPPILAGMSIDGTRYWAPEGTGILPPGQRIRQQFDNALVAPTADGGSLAYVGEFFPNVIIPRPKDAQKFVLGV